MTVSLWSPPASAGHRDACLRFDEGGSQGPLAEFRRDPLDVATESKACRPFRVGHPLRAVGIPGTGKRLLRLRRRNEALVPETLQFVHNLPVAGVNGIVLPKGPVSLAAGPFERQVRLPDSVRLQRTRQRRAESGTHATAQLQPAPVADLMNGVSLSGIGNP